MIAYYPPNLLLLAFYLICLQLIFQILSFNPQTRRIVNHRFNQLISYSDPMTIQTPGLQLHAKFQSISVESSANSTMSSSNDEQTSKLIYEVLADQGIDISDLIKSQKAIQNIINRSKNSSEAIDYAKMSALERQFMDLLDTDKASEKSRANAAKSRAIKEAKKLQKESVSSNTIVGSSNTTALELKPTKKRSNAITSFSRTKPKPQDK